METGPTSSLCEWLYSTRTHDIATTARRVPCLRRCAVNGCACGCECRCASARACARVHHHKQLRSRFLPQRHLLSSMHFDSFHYCASEEDVVMVVASVGAMWNGSMPSGDHPRRWDGVVRSMEAFVVCCSLVAPHTLCATAVASQLSVLATTARPRR